MTFLLNHLWQSTLFGAIVALVALLLKDSPAHWRCRLWLAASAKFLVPFATLAAFGSRFGWRPARIVVSEIWLSTGKDPISAPLSFHAGAGGAAAPIHASNLPLIFLLFWTAGFLVTLFRWWLSWRRVRAAVDAATPVESGREWDILRRVECVAGVTRPIPVMLSGGRMEPGIVGIFRPVLLWPAGISDRLADAQLEAILTHEVCHARRRDNMAAALHMLVETVFWFHPLVWWLRTRLIDEREKACDEAVLRMGSQPEVYADSILKACRFYLESPQMCMAGVTGSDLKQRIERIMSRRMERPLDLGRKLLLATLGAAAIAGPVLLGVVHAPAIRAQSPSATPPAFDVASVKPNHSDDHRVMFKITPGGRVDLSNVSPKMLIIIMVYNLKPNQLTGGPSWLDSEKYDINAKASGPDDPDQLKLMMQTLLADRFKLTVHRETKDMPIYELVAGKNGPKLKQSEEAAGEKDKSRFMIRRGQLELTSANMSQLADNLSRVTSRNVFDKTGITGTYDMKLEWTPDESEDTMPKGPVDGKDGPGAPPADNGPSLDSAIQEQLGLKLVAGKGPVQIVVIDHIEKASEN